MLNVVDRVSHEVLRALGARTSHVSTGAGRMHAYELRGQGEGAFVLLHGMGTTATSYSSVVRKLKPRAARVILLELPGHGRSEEPREGLRPDSLATGVREALDPLIGSGRAVVLGTSLGGAAALGYALERPEKVQALVLASPAGAPLEDRDVEELRARFDLRTRADARRFFTELLHAPPFYLRAFERGLVDQLSRPLVRGFLGALDPRDCFTEERVAALQVPTHLMWGKSDRILPRSGLAFYRRALPNVTIEELEGIGHSPHLERPALVAERMLSVFRRTLR